MKIKSFLGLVEIRTKLASIIPFSVGSIYAFDRFHTFNTRNFIFLFISMISFDMVTTALNNYFDFKRSFKKEGYNYEKHNTIVEDSLSETSVIGVTAFLLAMAVAFGILLYLNTGLLLLLAGMLSFGVGILYSFGPVPISRTPLGEVLSGFFMGFVITFLSVYVHIFNLNIVSIDFKGYTFDLHIQLAEVTGIFLLSIPVMCCIANIMLANNICDIDDDIENRRYTLPVYIGREKALVLFKALYIAAYLDIIILVISGLLPPVCLISLATYIPVNKNTALFLKQRTKKDTFAISVRNFMLIGLSLSITFGVSLF